MPATATNKVQTSKADLLAEFVAAEPIAQTRKAGPRKVFQADADILARVTKALSDTGAIKGAKLYGSDKEARAASRIWRDYALVAVEGFEGKTISTKIVQLEDKQWAWQHQLASKRVKKENGEATPETATANESAK